jgi:hypothetical protein
MHLKVKLFAVAAASLLVTCAKAQTIIQVPGDQPTIQQGINAANPGDTVLVAPGLYLEHLDFFGKAITVTSSAGPATTILDGGSDGPAVTFHSSESRSAVLSGLTIQHGGSYPSEYVPAQASLLISESSPTIQNNIITQSVCWGIQTIYAAPLIQANEISATQVDPSLGGCKAAGGSAIYVGPNLDRGSSGSVNGTPAVISGNTIENNIDGGSTGGAGISVSGGTPVIVSNLIRNNVTSSGYGGAIYITDGDGTAIVQNLIYGNQAGCGGGAIAFDTSTLLIANNTLANNTSQGSNSPTDCAAISQIYPSPGSFGESDFGIEIVNNIISGSTSYPAVNCSQVTDPSQAFQPIFDHNLLYNAGSSFFGSDCVDVSADYGNIAAAPQFVDPDNGNFQLLASSPAIDSGNNSVLQSIAAIGGSPLATDLAGSPRVQDATGKGYPVIDMGPYEYPGTIDGSPTTVVLTSSAYYGYAGSNYTLTANLVSPLGTPSGTVYFFLDGKQIGASTIGASGIATLAGFVMPPGVHNLYATYPGQGSFTPAISVVIIVDIDVYSTSLDLMSSPDSSQLGQNVTFTATLTSPDGTVLSPITLTDTLTNTVLAQLTPNSAGVATYNISTLTVGDHPVQAVYAGDNQHTSSYGTVYQTVDAYATVVNLTCTPLSIAVGGSVALLATVSSPGGVPTGSILFSDNDNPLGQAPLANGSASFNFVDTKAGNNIILATLPATGDFAESSASCTVVATGNAFVTTTVLTANPLVAAPGSPVTLTAMVSAPSPAGVPTGSVTFFDGTTSLGHQSLDASGHATLTTSSLALGVHSLTAAYPAVADYAGSVSQPVQVTIVASAFTLTLSPSSVTIAAGKKASIALALQSLGNYTGTVTLAYGTLPPFGSATITPSTVTLTAGENASATLEILTSTVQVAKLSTPPGSHQPPWSGLGGESIATAALLLLWRDRRRTKSLQRCLRWMPAVILAAVMMQALTGCTEISIPIHSVAAGTYQIPVTATDANGQSKTATLTLMVTRPQ